MGGGRESWVENFDVDSEFLNHTIKDSKGCSNIIQIKQNLWFKAGVIKNRFFLDLSLLFFMFSLI